MSKRIVYYPPPREFVFDYARAVCQRLAETKGENYIRPEVIDGFARFLYLIANILVRQMNSDCEREDKVAENTD